MSKKSKMIDGVVIPAKVGGPAEWVPNEYNYETIERCSSIGMKEATIAGVIGIHPATLDAAKSKYPRVKESLANSNGRLQDNLTMQVMNYINDPTVPYAAKRKDIQFVLSMKCGWRINVNVQHEDKPQLPTGLTFEQVTSIELDDE
jgi:hypothetical protein